MEVDLEMDAFGRVLFPKAVRNLFNTRKFIAKVEKTAIVMTPLETLRESVGTCPDVDMKKFFKQRHEGWHG